MLLSTKQKILYPAFFIVAAVFFSFLVSPGYQSFVSDQTIFIPLVYRALDPALFPNDLSWFEVMHTKRTLMTDFILLFVRGGIDIFWVLFHRILEFSQAFLDYRQVVNSRFPVGDCREQELCARKSRQAQ